MNSEETFDRDNDEVEPSLAWWGELGQRYKPILMENEELAAHLADYPDTPLKQLIRYRLLTALGRRAGLTWANAPSVEALGKERQCFRYFFIEHDDVPVDEELCLTMEDCKRFFAWEAKDAKLQCKTEYELAPQCLRLLVDDAAALNDYADRLVYLSTFINRRHLPKGLRPVREIVTERFPDTDFETFWELTELLGYCDEDGKIDYRLRFCREADALSVLAAFNRLSCFSEDRRPVAESLGMWLMEKPIYRNREMLQRVLDVSEYTADTVAEALLNLDSNEDDFPSSGGFLLHALAKGVLCDPKLRERVCRRLFLHFTDKEQLRYFIKHEKDETYLFVRDFVQKSYRASVAENQPYFYYAAAALQMREAQEAEEVEKNVENAMKDALSQNNEKAFLAIVMLGLYAYSDCFEFVDTPSFKLNLKVQKRIVRLAFCPDSILHRACYSAIEDLIASGYIYKSLLWEPDVQLRAKKMLMDERLAVRAEEILAGCSFYQVFHPARTEYDEELKERYLKRYRAADADGRISLFPLCLMLGCWDDVGKEIKQLCHEVCRSKALMLVDTRQQLTAIAEEIDVAFKLSPCPQRVEKACTVAPASLRSGDYNMLQRLFASGRSYVVTTEAELAVLIRYLDSFAVNELAGEVVPQTDDDAPCMLFVRQTGAARSDKAMKEAKERNVVEHTVVEAPLFSPYLITRWFYFLCKCGRPERLDSFVSRYLDVLTRPDHYPDVKAATVLLLGDAVETRLQAALRLYAQREDIDRTLRKYVKEPFEVKVNHSLLCDRKKGEMRPQHGNVDSLLLTELHQKPGGVLYPDRIPYWRTIREWYDDRRFLNDSLCAYREALRKNADSDDEAYRTTLQDMDKWISHLQA